MGFKFTPSGFLDVATDPADLPTQSDGKSEVSGAMTRCTNLRLTNAGMAETRFGSEKINSSAMWRDPGVMHFGSNLFADPRLTTQAAWSYGGDTWTYTSGKFSAECTGPKNCYLVQKTNMNIVPGKLYRFRGVFSSVSNELKLYIRCGGTYLNGGKAIYFESGYTLGTYFVEYVVPETSENVEFFVLPSNKGAVGTTDATITGDLLELCEVLSSESGRIDHMNCMEGNRYEFGTFDNLKFDNDISIQASITYSWEDEITTDLTYQALTYWSDEEVTVTQEWEKAFYDVQDDTPANEYAFSNPFETGRLAKIYRNERLINYCKGGDFPWSSVQYQTWNTEIPQILALNGTERKRIEGEWVYEWGVESPVNGLFTSANASTAFTQDWEDQYAAYISIVNTTPILFCESLTGKAATGSTVFQLSTVYKTQGDYGIYASWPAGQSEITITADVSSAPVDFTGLHTVYLDMWILDQGAVTIGTITIGGDAPISKGATQRRVRTIPGTSVDHMTGTVQVGQPTVTTALQQLTNIQQVTNQPGVNIPDTTGTNMATTTVATVQSIGHPTQFPAGIGTRIINQGIHRPTITQRNLPRTVLRPVRTPVPTSRGFFEFGEAGYDENSIEFDIPASGASATTVAVDISNIPNDMKNSIGYMRIRRVFATTTTSGSAIAIDWIRGEGQSQLAVVPTKITRYHWSDREVIFDWEWNHLDRKAPINDKLAARYMYVWELIAKGIANWNVVYTYCRKRGEVLEAESNPSPESGFDTETGIGFRWASPKDRQITHVRVYRTLSTGGGNFYYDSEWPVGAAVGSAEPDDTALGAEVETNHYRPPLGHMVAGPLPNGTLFIAQENRLYYCLPKRPEYWPVEYYIEVGPHGKDITAVVFYQGLPFVMNSSEIWQIQGSAHGSFNAYPMAALTGSLSQNTTVSVRGQGIFHTGQDGIYRFLGGKDERITETRFGPIFDGLTKGSMRGMDLDLVSKSFILCYRNHLYFAYVGIGASYPDNVIVTNLLSGKSVHYNYSMEMSAGVVDSTNDKLFVAATDGHIWRLEMPTKSSDNGTAISWDLATKDYGVNLRKIFPRYARYDVDMGATSAGRGHILVNGRSVQQHILRGSRDNRKRHIDTCAGDRVALRMTGKGKVRIFTAEVE